MALAKGHKFKNMKKLLLLFSLVLCLVFFASIVKAEEQPTCDAGSHYVGTYQEQENCQKVCTKKIFGFCIKYENQCTTTGSWVGTCELDEVVEPEDPIATSTDPIIDPEDGEATSTPPVATSTPVFKVIYTNNLMGILNSYCKDDQVEYTPWQKLPNFNLEIRSLKLNEFGKSIFNGCTPTTEHQVNQLRVVGQDIFGLQL